MSAAAVVKYRLGTHAGVTAIVGTSPADRVYPVQSPEEPVYPLIVYQQTGADRYHGAHGDPGVVDVTVRVAAFAELYDDARALAEQVRLALDRYGSSITGTPIAGTVVYDIRSTATDFDDYAPEIGVYMVVMDFVLTIEEPTA